MDGGLALLQPAHPGPRTRDHRYRSAQLPRRGEYQAVLGSHSLGSSEYHALSAVRFRSFLTGSSGGGEGSRFNKPCTELQRIQKSGFSLLVIQRGAPQFSHSLLRILSTTICGSIPLFTAAAASLRVNRSWSNLVVPSNHARVLPLRPRFSSSAKRARRRPTF